MKERYFRWLIHLCFLFIFLMCNSNIAMYLILQWSYPILYLAGALNVFIITTFIYFKLRVRELEIGDPDGR
jgi:hypothetical protein